jgi:hypothetical protein
MKEFIVLLSPLSHVSPKLSQVPANSNIHYSIQLSAFETTCFLVVVTYLIVHVTVNYKILSASQILSPVRLTLIKISNLVTFTKVHLHILLLWPPNLDWSKNICHKIIIDKRWATQHYLNIGLNHNILPRISFHNLPTTYRLHSKSQPYLSWMRRRSRLQV